MLVEVCANSLESALVAQDAGADRIELCTELAVGGLTPSYGLLVAVKRRISIPVHVLIRPRSGDFAYTEEEREIMLRDIEKCVELGFNGIVCGALHKDFSLDVAHTQQLKEASGELHFTFHRAFDWVKDPFETLVQLKNVGVDTLLTSGQKPTAVEGIELLSVLKNGGSGIHVMPGSGINADNVSMFKERGFKAVHFSGTSMVGTLPEKRGVSMNCVRLLSDDGKAISQFDKISAVIAKVK